MRPSFSQPMFFGREQRSYCESLLGQELHKREENRGAVQYRLHRIADIQLAPLFIQLGVVDMCSRDRFVNGNLTCLSKNSGEKPE